MLINNKGKVEEGESFKNELQEELRKNGQNVEVKNNGKTIKYLDTANIYKLNIQDGKVEKKENGYDFLILADGSSTTSERSQAIRIELFSGVNYLVYSNQSEIKAERYVNDIKTGEYFNVSGIIQDSSRNNAIPEVLNEISGINTTGFVIHGALKVAPSEKTYGNISGYLQIYDEDNNEYIPVENTWYNLTKDGLKTNRVIARNCIDVDTLVTMADGSQKRLGDIEVGDDVLSVDWNTKTLVSRKVIYSGKDEADYQDWYVNCYWENKFSDGTIIKQAMRHRFYCLEEEAFKHLHDWTVGLHSYKIDGTNPEMISRTLVQGRIQYSRITLENDNNYFANGLLTGDSESQAGIPLTEFLPRQ